METDSDRRRKEKGGLVIRIQHRLRAWRRIFTLCFRLLDHQVIFASFGMYDRRMLVVVCF